MECKTTKGCADNALEAQDVSSNDTMSLDGGEVCTVSVEIDNALSDDPNLPTVLDGQSELFSSNSSSRKSVLKATDTLQKNKGQNNKLEAQDVSSNDTMSLDGGEVCTASVEIDNALSDDPNLPAVLEGQSEFFSSGTHLKKSVEKAIDELGKNNEQSMNVSEDANDTLIAEEATSDQSQLSEGILVNADGINKIASFDSEFPPLTYVKTEPVDVEDENEIDHNLSITQCALQLQFTENGHAAGVALVKKENCRKMGSKQNRQGKKGSMAGRKKKCKNKPMRPSSYVTKVLGTDLCLVCSAPCIITKNRKIPSLPFCKKCKKAYFYQLANMHRKKYNTKCLNDRKCVIHYKNGSHCSNCHLEKFQQILRSSKAAFRSAISISRPESAGIQRPKRTVQEHKVSSIFTNDPQLIKEALNSYPLVVLDKMKVEPDEIIDTKDLPDVFITSVKKPNQENGPAPRMFVMPYDDVIKQEVPLPSNEDDLCEIIKAVVNGSPKSGKSVSPSLKLGPIKSSNGPQSSTSSTSVSSLPGQGKRRRGRPRKSSSPCPGSGSTANKIASPEILKQILAQPPNIHELRKIEAKDNDVKIFVFQCGHACSACNSSPSKQWLHQNGFQSTAPAQHQQSNVQADSNLYQKFVEFYNAAVNSVPQSGVAKAGQNSVQPSKVFVSESRFPNQPKVVVIPASQQHLVGLASPISGPSHSTFGAGLPSSSFQAVPTYSKLPFPPVKSSNSSGDQLHGGMENISVNDATNIAYSVPPVADMNAVRLALNAQLVQRSGRLDFLPQNRFVLAPQHLAQGMPLQAISPSSSVRQPRAPYLLSPSIHLAGSSGSSSAKARRI